MLLGKKELLVHWKHFLDGYPICWRNGEMGTFEGTRDEQEVTCPACLIFLEETYDE